MPIRELPPEVVAQIAAGEVVERPAAVVKELLENALDAGARHVRLDLAGGGLDLIRVTDDGQGIPAEELSLAVTRHATSKLRAAKDLARIGTLGFRGEALASIGTVAHLTLLSRTAQRDAGARLTMEHGALGTVQAAAAAPGTSVTVRDLFASLPARLKFLKTRATETSHCVHLVEQYALAYPEVRFAASVEGRQVLTTPGDGQLASALLAVYGLRVAEQMVLLPGSEPGTEPGADEAPPRGTDEVRVRGAISRPSCYKGTRQYLTLFVNRRLVQSRTLTYAVEEAYHSLLLPGRHPVAVVTLALDPVLTDVNVHPAKTEIKFVHERQVYAAVQRAVRATLLEHAETPDVSARAFLRPAWEAEPAPPAPPREPGEPADAAPRQEALFAQGGGAATRTSGFSVPGAAASAPVGGGKLPVLRVLGQVSQSYIITEGPNGVYLVDQHAAHERILLERMVEQWRTRAVTAQLLLEPLPLELAPAEREAVEAHLEALQRIGFELEPFGGDALLLRGVPAPLAKEAQAEQVRTLLLDLVGADAEAASHGETWEEHALANVACKAAIKAGQTLAPEEQRALIQQLEGARAHQSCCHGRPTMVHLSLAALEREFERR